MTNSVTYSGKIVHIVANDNNSIIVARNNGLDIIIVANSDIADLDPLGKHILVKGKLDRMAIRYSNRSTVEEEIVIKARKVEIYEF